MSSPLGSTAGALSSAVAQVWRRRLLFCSVFAGTLALVALIFALVPTRYVAVGSVMITDQDPATKNASAASVQKLGDPADLESQLLLIRSPRLLRMALAPARIVETVQRECRQLAQSNPIAGWTGSDRRCDELLPDSDRLLDYVQARYAISAVGRSRVLAVSYQSPLPDVAQLMTNALVDAYLDDLKASSARSREQTAGWLWKEIEDLDRQLREEDRLIQEFRRSKGLVRGATAPISSERLTSITQQLALAERTRGDAEARLAELNGRRGDGPAEARLVLESRTVSDLKQQLATLTTQIASATRTLGPLHPTNLALQREQENLQARLAAEIGNILKSAQRAFAAADAQVKALRAQLEQSKGEVANAASDEARIADMVRSAEIKRALYVDLYKRASEIETERRVLIGPAKLVSYAERPLLPAFPKRIPFAAVGLMLAFVFATAAVLIRERLDRRIWDAVDLETASRLPVLARIPAVGRAGKSGMPLFGLGTDEVPLLSALKPDARSFELEEEVRRLNATLATARRDRPLRSLLVTSPSGSEGKTFVALALARLAAASGRSVLLIEADMRRPTLAGSLKLASGPGLRDVLAGSATWEAAVRQSGARGLDILPAGTPSNSSTELLMNARLGSLLDETSRYDMVVVDSPPSELVMDARIIGRLVDGVLCCTRYGETRLDRLESAVRNLAQSGAHVLGIVLGFNEAAPEQPYTAHAPAATSYLVAAR